MWYGNASRFHIQDDLTDKFDLFPAFNGPVIVARLLTVRQDFSAQFCRYAVGAHTLVRVAPLNRIHRRLDSTSSCANQDRSLRLRNTYAGTWKLEYGSWSMVSGLWILEHGRSNVQAGTWLLKPGCGNLDAATWMLESGCWNLDARTWMLEYGCWT